MWNVNSVESGRHLIKVEFYCASLRPSLHGGKVTLLEGSKDSPRLHVKGYPQGYLCQQNRGNLKPSRGRLACKQQNCGQTRCLGGNSILLAFTSLSLLLLKGKRRQQQMALQAAHQYNAAAARLGYVRRRAVFRRRTEERWTIGGFSFPF